MRTPSKLTDIFSLADPTMADSVGARIRLLRQRRGMTQHDFAQALGVSRSSIALWETNRGGEAGHLEQIAHVLDVSVEFFINGLARHDVDATLTLDENALVSLYRGCGASEQLALLRMAGRLQRQSQQREQPAAGATEPAPDTQIRPSTKTG